MGSEAEFSTRKVLWLRLRFLLWFNSVLGLRLFCKRVIVDLKSSSIWKPMFVAWVFIVLVPMLPVLFSAVGTGVITKIVVTVFGSMFILFAVGYFLWEWFRKSFHMSDTKYEYESHERWWVALAEYAGLSGVESQLLVNMNAEKQLSVWDDRDRLLIEIVNGTFSVYADVAEDGAVVFRDNWISSSNVEKYAQSVFSRLTEYRKNNWMEYALFAFFKEDMSSVVKSAHRFGVTSEKLKFFRDENVPVERWDELKDLPDEWIELVK